MRELFHASGAGHTIRGKYRVYGEGSVRHNGSPCEHGLDLDRHPLIFRYDYDSIWQYWRTELVQWCLSKSMAYNARHGVFDRLRKEGTTKTPMSLLPTTPWDQLAKIIGVKPYPHRSAEAALRPEDSIYKRDDNWFSVLHLHAIIDLGARHLTPAEWLTLDAWSKTIPADTAIIRGAPVEGCPFPATWIPVRGYE